MKYFTFALMILLSFNLFANELIFNTQDFKPYSYLENNIAKGAGVEIIEAVCKKAKLQYKINFYPWARAQKDVEEGKAQGLFVLAKSAEREQWLNFSEPLIDTEYAFFVSIDDKTQYKSVNEFKNKIIGVYGPSNTSSALEKLASEVGNITIEMTPDDIEAFKKLDTKRIDVVYSNRDVGQMFIKDLKLNNIKLGISHKKIVYSIALSKQFTDEESTKIFFEALKSMKTNGEIKKILDKYKMREAF